MNDAVIHLENVCFSYNKAPVLKNISTKFSPNRITFIMGNNGSGKTTLLKNIMGFLSPQKGKISVDNTDTKTIDKITLSKIISYVPQAIHLNTDFSVLDYLALGRTPHMGLIAKMRNEDYTLIDRLSQKMGINDLFDSPFNDLSGGQKQLVAITRSLVQDTPIIILDEPMSALDIGKQVNLLNILLSLSESGKTILLTTHNPNHALSIDSDSCFLSGGEIVASGQSQSIIDETLLLKIYGDYVSLIHDGVKSTVAFNVKI